MHFRSHRGDDYNRKCIKHHLVCAMYTKKRKCTNTWILVLVQTNNLSNGQLVKYREHMKL